MLSFSKRAKKSLKPISHHSVIHTEEFSLRAR